MDTLRQCVHTNNWDGMHVCTRCANKSTRAQCILVCFFPVLSGQKAGISTVGILFLNGWMHFQDVVIVVPQYHCIAQELFNFVVDIISPILVASRSNTSATGTGEWNLPVSYHSQGHQRIISSSGKGDRLLPCMTDIPGIIITMEGNRVYWLFNKCWAGWGLALPNDRLINNQGHVEAVMTILTMVILTYVFTCVQCMNGWKDGRKERWKDGRMDGWMDVCRCVRARV